jgi:hypothetical protein
MTLHTAPCLTRLSFISAKQWMTLGAMLVLAWSPQSQAAAPASGSISASSTSPLTWVGTGTGGASAGEASCADGANCDVFTLTLNGAPADYAGKIVKLNFSWTLPATDYDFYIHKDTIDGAIVATGANGGAPDTTDQAAIDPVASGAGVYIVHVVYFSSPGLADEYNGSATVAVAAAAVRTATYLHTGISFSPNIPLKAPVAARDGEPSSRTDFLGNTYVGGIRGFPAGVDLWYFNLNAANPEYDPFMRVPNYRGQPDGFSPSSAADLGGDGGGDIDLAVGFGIATGKTDPTLAFSSLIAANISTGQSFDLAESYSRNTAGNVTGGIPADDRQWEEFLGESSVYLLYRTLEPAVTQIQRSDDGGFTFGAAATAGAIGQVGPVDVFQGDGTVYAPGSTGSLAVGTPLTSKGTPLSTDYKVRTAASDPNGVAHLFFVTKVADDGTANGTVYACYSNDKDIFLKSSKDKGVTWTDPVRVNDGTSTKVNVFPWMETGSLPGSVGVVWYGTTSPTNDDTAEWKVFFAQSFDADGAAPTFRIAEVTEPEHVIHAANISEGGLTGTANRNLIDYFQVSFDPQGAAVVAYTDDHNDFDGHTYVSHQITGPSIKTGAALAAPVEGSGLTLPKGTATVADADAFPPAQPGPNGEQVTDFALDVQNGLLARVPTADPFDITSVRYDSSGTGESLAIGATMKVSDLSTIPPSGTWQMNFTVNAPHSVLSPTGTYSFGASDHGDQFYIEADTDGSGAQTFTYGIATRLSTGSLSYTQIGTADAGSFNSTDNTISVQVSVAKLNAALPQGHTPILNGTVVTGLRARAITAANPGTTRAHNDLTRGGTQFVVHDSASPPVPPTPTPTPLPSPPPGASPTPPTVELANISTRLAVKTGDQAGIGGFIVRPASSSTTKRLIVRGIGPSLQFNGTPLAGRLLDPVLEVRDSSGALVTNGSNDNWRGAQQAEINSSGLAPKDDNEAAVIVNLPGGNYTAALRGAKDAQGNDTQGIGLIEIFDVDAGSNSDLGNISTRGPVGVGDDVLIGGLIVRDSSSNNGSQSILVRGIGPSLTPQGVPDALQDPTLKLFDANGAVIATNDNWKFSPKAAQIAATMLAPSDDRESAILETLVPGAYTAILSGVGNTTGIGRVDAFNLGNQ